MNLVQRVFSDSIVEQQDHDVVVMWHSDVPHHMYSFISVGCLRLSCIQISPLH